MMAGGAALASGAHAAKDLIPPPASLIRFGKIHLGKRSAMRVRIYQPARNAMQSGTARSRAWVLEYPQADRLDIDPLMGWTSSDDTQSQVRLRFATRAEAEDYAKDNHLDYVVVEPNKRAQNVRPRGYGENFATDRHAPWTH